AVLPSQVRSGDGLRSDDVDDLPRHRRSGVHSRVGVVAAAALRCRTRRPTGPTIGGRRGRPPLRGAGGTIMTRLLRCGLMIGITLAVSCGGVWAQAGAPKAPQPDQAMLAKQAREVGLKAGMVLGKDNWELAKDVLPPEILRHYKDGEYVNKVIEW